MYQKIHHIRVRYLSASSTHTIPLPRFIELVSHGDDLLWNRPLALSTASGPPFSQRKAGLAQRRGCFFAGSAPCEQALIDFDVASMSVPSWQGWAA